MSAPAGARPVTRVAVGVLVRGDGAVLLADRPAGKPYAAYWEFPGGKIEPGETVEAALARELHEELGVDAAPSDPWAVLEHDYPHAYVRLYFRRVFEWRGTPRALEGQRLCWLRPGAPAPAPLLPAALPPLRWIRLPAVCLRSPGDAADGVAAEAWLEGQLERGLRQLIWHEPGLDDAALARALAHGAARARLHGARLLADARSLARCPALARGVDGVFMETAELRAADRHPPADWFGAAVRTRSDLERAFGLGCDFVVAQADGSGPAAERRARELCREARMPVYRVAAPSAGSLAAARADGAHGLLAA